MTKSLWFTMTSSEVLDPTCHNKPRSGYLVPDGLSRAMDEVAENTEDPSNESCLMHDIRGCRIEFCQSLMLDSPHMDPLFL